MGEILQKCVSGKHAAWRCVFDNRTEARTDNYREATLPCRKIRGLQTQDRSVKAVEWSANRPGSTFRNLMTNEPARDSRTEQVRVSVCLFRNSLGDLVPEEGARGAGV